MKFEPRMASACVVLTALLASPAFAEGVEVNGVLHEGTPGEVVYRAITPDDWNGTLVLDLDFNRWPEDRINWYLDQGYAVGGNQRTQNQTAYEIHDYVDNMLATRDLLVEAGAEQPDRLIAIGASRGGFVSRAAVQYKPDEFAGALTMAGGGGGLVSTWNQKADAVWALKTLAAPDAPLAASDLPDLPEGEAFSPAYQQDQALNELIGQIRDTDEGAARLVLGAALSQTTGWREGPRPADDDFETRGQQIVENFGWAHPQFVHKEIEVMSGGPITWNQGYDYAEAVEQSGMLDLVEWWYDKAGLDLDADLETLADAPRYTADPEAVAAAEQVGTYDGTGGPILALKTIGDNADSTSLDVAFTDLFEYAGNADLLRTVFIERPAHSSQSELERRAGLQVLIERLDSGEWPDTSAEAMNARAAQLAAESTGDEDLGESRFIPFDPVPPLRTWDVRDHGSYQPEN